MKLRVCTSLGRFFRDGDYTRWRGCYIRKVQPQDWSIEFFQDLLLCPKHVGRTAVALRVATIFVAAHLTRTRTSPERMCGQLLQLPHQDLLRTRYVRVCARWGSADPAKILTEVAALTTPPGGVIKQHATMEHSQARQAALRAGPATVKWICWPAGPSCWLGPAWADQKPS